ncbi:hypothetical protein PIB30_044843 [Stylosanthes scabra]|uniref:Uncharacterized protein n=1 Tax=Stylosanthes scabra TaxID=79078 RepID=A0ABU6YGG0_9FABA|nr:hypothetical protein [Stylosanthes scabra]
MERHMEMPGPNNITNKLSVFHLTRYSPARKTKRSLNMVEFQDMVKIRSLDKTCETIFQLLADNTFKWKLQDKLQNLRIYDNPKMCFQEDLITLNGGMGGLTLDELIISRLIFNGEYKRKIIQCQTRGHSVQIKSITTYRQSTFPV